MKNHIIAKTILTFFLATMFLQIPAFAAAKKKPAKSLKLCVNGTSIIARKSCKKNEMLLDKSNTAGKVLSPPVIQGPPGKKGDAGGMGPAGDTGPKGFTGSKGDSGFTGSKGDLGFQGKSGTMSFDPLESGNGAFGLNGGDYYTPDGGGTECTYIQFRTQNSSNDFDVVIKRTHYFNFYCSNQEEPGNCCQGNNDSPCFPNVVASDSRCSGSDFNPTASGGALCIYPSLIINVDNPRVVSKNRYGVKICWDLDGLEGQSSFKLKWALSAP